MRRYWMVKSGRQNPAFGFASINYSIWNISISVLLHAVLLFSGNELSNKLLQVTASSSAQQPFLGIEKPASTRLIITKPRLPHFLPCIATIDAAYYYNNTEYYHTWYRNDKPTEFSISRNGTLRLPANEKSGGVYRCKINANSTAVLSEAITVDYPILRKVHSNLSHIALPGMPLRLDCPVQSIPPANITWFFGNVSLSKLNQINRFRLLANGSLILRKVQITDMGKYKCLASNQYALKTRRQFLMPLNVLDYRSLDAASSNVRRGQLVPPLQNQTLYLPLHENLTLSCWSIYTDISVEWWFQRNSEATAIKLSNNSDIYRIHSSLAEDEGFYTCSTKVDRQTFRVIVTTPPEIVEGLSVYNGTIASSISLRCIATGNPHPTITWYHNGAIFNNSYTRYIGINELRIPSFDPDESGIYQCFLRNIAGEVYSAGEIRLRNNSALIANPLRNIKCYAHSFNSINVTFENDTPVSLLIVHIGLTKPYRWQSPFPPMEIDGSFVIIYKHLPYLRPFEIVTRVLIPTMRPDSHSRNKHQQQGILSTLRSKPVICCTQGLPPRFVAMGQDDMYVTWSTVDITSKKYFIVQFAINYTLPDPRQFSSNQQFNGTTELVNLTPDDIKRKLRPIQLFNRSETDRILKNFIRNNNNDDVDGEDIHSHYRQNIFSLVLPANVTGLLLRNCTRLKLRVLIITSENEYLAQDLRYVEWKSSHNNEETTGKMPFRLLSIESRMLRFRFDETIRESCIQICHLRLHYPRLLKEERVCVQRHLEHSLLEIRNLKAAVHYNLHFSSCSANVFYGQIDVATSSDPPGPINSQRITRQNGLKLSWDPPLQPNGKIHHYNILWTLDNITHETNVLACSVCFYKFPNISETAKINVSIRAVGETGVSAPIYIDLRHINHRSLEIENTSSMAEMYSGIAIGSMLSALCICLFAILITMQRRRFKARQQPQRHSTPTSTDMNFTNLRNARSSETNSTVTTPANSYEMQTLISKITPDSQLNIIREEYRQGKEIPNGKPIKHCNRSTPSISSIETDLNQSSAASLYYNKMPHLNKQEFNSKPFIIAFKNPPNKTATMTQMANQENYAGLKSNDLPNSLPTDASPIVSSTNSISLRRNSSSSITHNVGSSTSTFKTKSFHSNFPKSVKSTDGIYLLAEEQSTSTITDDGKKANIPNKPPNNNGYRTIEVYDDYMTSDCMQRTLPSAASKLQKNTTNHHTQLLKSNNLLDIKNPANDFQTKRIPFKPDNVAENGTNGSSYDNYDAYNHYRSTTNHWSSESNRSSLLLQTANHKQFDIEPNR